MPAVRGALVIARLHTEVPFDPVPIAVMLPGKLAGRICYENEDNVKTALSLVSKTKLAVRKVNDC